jgi:hypothetical protein
VTVLTEDAVIDAVCRHLVADRWEIVSRATATEHGVDIVATREGARLEVEAKGAGSSKPYTARYGQVFNRGQVFDHVAKAVLKALRVASAGNARAAIAFPDNGDHRAEVELVRVALQRAGIIVFWVSEEGTVRVEGDHS